MKTMTSRSVLALATLTVLVGMPATSNAQAARSGPTFVIGGTPITTLPDVAYDSINSHYLVVSEDSSHTVIAGQIVDTAGTRLSAFVIASSPFGTQMPRVAFGAGVNGGGGGFMVVWHEAPPGANFTQLKGRIISSDGTGLTAPFVLSTEAVSATSSTSWIIGPTIAYSTTSQEFLAAWMGSYGVTNEIRFMRVGLTGALLQAAPTTITAGTADWERDPSVAYNPDDDEFFISYAGYWDAKRYAYVAGRRVKAGTGAVLGSPTEYTQTLATYVPAVTYNLATKQYLVSWYHRNSSVAAIYGIPVNRDGSPGAAVRILSSRYFAYDANDLKYNPVSGDYLLVTHGNNPEPWEDAGVSITSDGTPYDNGFIVTHTPDVRALMPDPANKDGNFYPRIAASTASPKWLLVTSSLFKSINGQFVASSSTTGPGGPAPSPTPTPSPTPSPTPNNPQPNPKMNVDYPSVNGAVAGNLFLVSGWAIDQGASSGAGVDVIDVWAYPAGSPNAIYVGSATYGIARPDVAAFVGAGFTNCGYTLLGSLPAPGAYDLYVFAHSTVSGTFNNVKIVRVNVQAAVSNPKMWLDTPAANQTISQNVTVAGWAVDLGAASGTGVDTVHVWAYPLSGASPVFVGVATYGTSRPDVGGFAGSARFTPSGFVVTGTLPSGDYNLVAFAHSTVTNTFNNVVLVPIKVR